ncbi:MAG: Uma2 family endonuclease [Kofleriaceae bacterium]|nr:Uma2 family endonuclease [Kofleriaceae bacterium]
MNDNEHRRFTIAEYVELERYSNVKHEYIDGLVVAMGGGTVRHARLAASIIAALEQQLADRPCEVYTSDARIRIQDPNVITYPDISVGCGPVEVDDTDECAQTNPTVLIEVTSPSSEGYDRGKKFAFYRAIPSLREYVIVDQEEPSIEVFRRGEDGTWSLAEHGKAGERVALPSIGCVLDVDAIYRNRRPRASN